VQAAHNYRDTELSRLEATLGTLKADNARKLTDAETRTAALVAEARGEVASRLARAEADVSVQKARVEQVRRQLQADVLEPARARKAAAEASAKGAAAQIIEQGRATAAAMDEIALAWKQVGDKARSVFLLQKVEGLMHQVMQTVSALKVEKLTVLGGIGGSGLGSGGDLTGRVIAAGEQLKAAAGVDLLAALRDRVIGNGNPAK
jgi:flotillin